MPRTSSPPTSSTVFHVGACTLKRQGRRVLSSISPRPTPRRRRTTTVSPRTTAGAAELWSCCTRVSDCLSGGAARRTPPPAPPSDALDARQYRLGQRPQRPAAAATWRVQRRGLHLEAVGWGAHRQPLEGVLVDQPQGGLAEPLPGQSALLFLFRAHLRRFSSNSCSWASIPNAVRGILAHVDP